MLRFSFLSPVFHASCPAWMRQGQILPWQGLIGTWLGSCHDLSISEREEKKDEKKENHLFLLKSTSKESQKSTDSNDTIKN